MSSRNKQGNRCGSMRHNLRARKMPSLLQLDPESIARTYQNPLDSRSAWTLEGNSGVETGGADTSAPPETVATTQHHERRSISTAWRRMTELSYGAVLGSKNLAFWNATDSSDVFDQLEAQNDLEETDPDVPLTSEIHILNHKQLLGIRLALSRLIESFKRFGSTPHRDERHTSVSYPSDIQVVSMSYLIQDISIPLLVLPLAIATSRRWMGAFLDSRTVFVARR